MVSRCGSLIFPDTDGRVWYINPDNPEESTTRYPPPWCNAPPPAPLPPLWVRVLDAMQRAIGGEA